MIFDDSLIDNYKEIDVVYETLLKEGFSLNSTIEKIKIEKTNLYRIYNKHNNGRLIYITFEKPDKKLTDDKEFKDINEETLLVCFDLYLSDSDKA